MADFDRYDAQVVGISVDSVPSHVAFAKSLGGIERYPLLADFHPKGDVSKKYGVYENTRFNRDLKRATFEEDRNMWVLDLDTPQQQGGRLAAAMYVHAASSDS